MRILFIDNIHPILKQGLQKKGHICDTAYDKNRIDIEEIDERFFGTRKGSP